LLTKKLAQNSYIRKKFACFNAVHKIGEEAGDEIFLVNPSEVVEIMKKVPDGKLITVVEICSSLAKKHQVKGCCTLTTGIFIMTAANAVEEEKKANRNLGIPYWRTLKADGFLNEKFPGGAESHKALLEKKGFEVAQKGKRYFVENYQSYLIKDF
jgi:alkylated DNA nucleotide flippase Atl1